MAVALTSIRTRLLARVIEVARRPDVQRTLASTLFAAAVISGIATYLAINGAFGSASNPENIFLLLILDMVLLLLFVMVVAWQLVVLWLERRRGLVGARLHSRLVLWFSLIAVTPTIIIGVLSALYFVLGVDNWFSDRVRTAVHDSLIVAESYLREHQQGVGSDALEMAAILREELPALGSSRERLEEFLNAQAALRSLSEVVIFDGNRRLLAGSEMSLLMEFDLGLPNDALDRAREGEVAIFTSRIDDRVRALIHLDSFSDLFLYVGRTVDAKVLAHMDKAKGAALIYEKLESQRSEILSTIGLIFSTIALLVLFAAIWAALIFANKLVKPVSTLVAAADRIGAGDLGTRVPVGPVGDELGTLSHAFNRMTEQISSQRDELVRANEQLEERRRFTEVVLAGVSAGVIGLDDAGRINLPNRSASDLLGIDLTLRIDQPIVEVVPEMGPLVQSARERPSWIAESQIDFVRGAETRTLLVRVVAEFFAARLIGFVVTFDDVTELLSAQRKAAWADVARRIAHEIKNPLTPIQLSAERLKRKYLKEISSDPETFVACTDTIVRQVGDIGRMIDEFSAFARMPAPVMATEDLGELCRQAVFLQQAGHGAIEYVALLPESPVVLLCDRHQVGQALTNILKNAGEAIESRLSGDGASGERGLITIAIEESPEDVSVVVEDNGRGLPDQGRERLTEPYVTTRARGTGLGLAIVKKITEDHFGALTLEDRPGGGARVRIVFRRNPLDASDAKPTAGIVQDRGRVHGG